MFTDINIYSRNNKTDYISENYIFYRKKRWYFPDFRSDLEQDPNPDPLFYETDPRIRIHIKMKRIRNTANMRRVWVNFEGQGYEIVLLAMLLLFTNVPSCVVVNWIQSIPLFPVSISLKVLSYFVFLKRVDSSTSSYALLVLKIKKKNLYYSGKPHFFFYGSANKAF